jgi:hypothetical protein
MTGLTVYVFAYLCFALSIEFDNVPRHGICVPGPPPYYLEV